MDSVEMANRMESSRGRDIEAPYFRQHRIQLSNEAQNETRIGSSRYYLLSFITTVSSPTKEQRLKLKSGNFYFSFICNGVH